VLQKAAVTDPAWYPMQEYLLHGVFYKEENEENENAR